MGLSRSDTYRHALAFDLVCSSLSAVKQEAEQLKADEVAAKAHALSRDIADVKRRLLELHREMLALRARGT